LYSRFIECGVNVRWFTPMIQGHVAYIKGKLGEHEVELVLISRR